MYRRIHSDATELIINKRKIKRTTINEATVNFRTSIFGWNVLDGL